MLEEVSYPSDLTRWKSETTDFYFELFGETSPVVDMTYAEVLPANSKDDDSTETASATPVYQYWWTLGHANDEPALKDEAAHVSLYFPLGGGWRIKELTATVKYLSPIQEHLNLLQKFGQLWGTAAPFVSEAAQLASVISPPAGGTAGSILSALAKLSLNNVPPTDGFAWSVQKITTNFEKHREVLQGVTWKLPKKMFTDLGGRLTGCLAVSFIPSRTQDGASVSTNEPAFAEQPILANAQIFTAHKTISLPGPDHQPQQYRDFISLYIRPQLPAKKDKQLSAASKAPSSKMNGQEAGREKTPMEAGTKGH